MNSTIENPQSKIQNRINPHSKIEQSEFRNLKSKIISIRNQKMWDTVLQDFVIVLIFPLRFF
ncbi:hypothetical protein D1AOALGA4SA_2208 [Olavius algarvensis Delta 1 endosymbiont]|nr:hypothetical protein D1AOALGA4SA_2208 [Olavius algarvensis Delta 1 endosymbiont]